jgi:hypothetical protein
MKSRPDVDIRLRRFANLIGFHRHRHIDSFAERLSTEVRGSPDLMNEVLRKLPILRENGCLPHPPPHPVCVADVVNVEKAKDRVVSVGLTKKIKVLDWPVESRTLNALSG